MDHLSKAQRSQNMARVKSRNSRPEMIVRRLAHSMGYRFRLHRSDLPGKPDLVFPRLRKIILVHGCFWHRHKCRRGRSMPSTRVAFWKSKLGANKERDRKIRRQLQRQGWDVLVVWECKITDLNRCADRIGLFLES